ncbi:MAG TPA: hypothetical protein VGB20_06595 [bacterium]
MTGRPASGQTGALMSCAGAAARACVLACALAWPAWAAASGDHGGGLRIRLAAHLHTTVSGGTQSPDAVAALAKSAGLDAVLITDSALRRWEYGLWPLRGLLKRVVEEPSVLRLGAAKYLAKIDAADRAHPDLLILPGMEAAPSYYWRRSPLERDGALVLGWHRHLLVFGIDDARSLRRLPLRETDPYHEDRDAAPFQRLIDAVSGAGGLVFWAHPAAANRGRAGGVRYATEPYPHLLELTDGYHGFGVADLAALSLTSPGGAWDRVLTEYCRGGRRSPAWILGELDWHGPHERAIDAVVTDVLSGERSRRGLLEGIRLGRMWVTLNRTGGTALRLEAFSLSDAGSSAVAVTGGTLTGATGIRVRIAGVASDGDTALTVIRDGEPWSTLRPEPGSFVQEWIDPSPPASGYYRVAADGPGGVVLTNPIFVGKAPE